MSFYGGDDGDGSARWGSSSRGGSAGPSNITGITAGTGSRPFLSRLEDSMAGSPPPNNYDGGGGYGGGGRHFDEEGVFSAEALSPGPEEGELDDLRRLGRVWVRERGTPDILAWEGDLIDSLLDKLEQQQKMLATLRADPATSEEEHFRLVLVQTEMERAKYLVRSYVRTRLHKIEKYSQHIGNSPELQAHLSGAELQHARRYADLVASHFQHSVLDSLPEWMRRTDEMTNDGVSMVSTPNVDTPVLVYCRKDCGEITVGRGELPVQLNEGTTHLVRYHLVKRWIELGWAEVL
ncbi:GINS complex subunit [Apiotrichum porosum]|uniref:DNA replication complex GINS protein SLD5 n=1 Tax=Apiotrichum porosum TaxID=105984 RepID=A0A427YBV8_9TREE|nr:GINS complex subunit [Apiotrichum porosum]RSH88447.1 GINS complex subunit [Apiotrichum porosum]